MSFTWHLRERARERESEHKLSFKRYVLLSLKVYKPCVLLPLSEFEKTHERECACVRGMCVCTCARERVCVCMRESICVCTYISHVSWCHRMSSKKKFLSFSLSLSLSRSLVLSLSLSMQARTHTRPCTHAPMNPRTHEPTHTFQTHTFTHTRSLTPQVFATVEQN